MSQHLFLFTIGPVQSFIAQARKTQDLYAGSRILSELIKTGIETIPSKYTIIFPFAEDLEDIESLPNRFIALIEEETDLQKLGKEVEDAVRNKWNNQIAHTSIFTKIIQANCSLNSNDYQQQIDQHLDIYWLFEKVSIAEGYAKAFESIERKLGAIKNVRLFEQFNNGLGEKGRKCSVDGFRNVKFYRKSESQKMRKNLKTSFLFADDNCVFDYDEPKLPLSILQPGEGLSAVSFVKRCYANDNSFESTADIALLDWKNCLKDNTTFRDFERCFSEFNAQLYFDENINENYFKKQGIRLRNGKTIDTINADLKKLKDSAKEVGFKQSKYYAILAFDGDSMGEWLSNASTWKEHQNFSKLLIAFAQKAKDFLDGELEGEYFNQVGEKVKFTKIKRGRAVYAGGDDFLGFVNLEYLFEVLIWMRDNFKTDISDKKPFGTNPLTFSAGICIAHYKEPLSIVLNRARQMEHKAKDWNNGRKNAFGIAVMKGSGEDHETIWGFENQSLESIQFLVNEMRKDNVSNTFLKSFQREFAPTLVEDGSIELKFREPIRVELKRLIYRSCTNGDREQKENKANELSKLLIHKLLPLNYNVKNFFSLLNIADFLHRILNKLDN